MPSLRRQKPVIASAEPPQTATTGRGRFTQEQRIDRTRKLIRAMNQQPEIRKMVEESIVASAQLMDDAKSAATPNAVARTWQHSAFGYQRQVGELNAAAMYVGNCLSRVELVVGKRLPNGTVVDGFKGDVPVEGLNASLAEEANELIGQFQGPRGGQKELMRSYGEKIFIGGECYLLPEDTPAGIAFEILSPQELLRDGDWILPNGVVRPRYNRYYGPGYAEDPVPQDSIPIRVWRPDTQWQKLATSSVRSCLEILEELVILTRLVRASAISRMALSGLLLIPDEIDTPDEVVNEDGSLSEARNPWAVDFINTAAKAVQDPASAAAFAPGILQAPAEYLAPVRHIPLQGEDQEHVIQRMEALNRLAQGLDLPVEVVRGYTDTKFANAGVISADTFKLHLEPTLEMLANALTVGYLWPAMADNRGIDAEHLRDAPYPADILNVAVFYDASKLISRPDRIEETIKAWQVDISQQAIGIADLRTVLGLDPDTPPTDEEVQKRIDGIRLTKERVTIQAPTSDAPVPVADATAKTGADTVGLDDALPADKKATTASLAAQIAGAAELTTRRAVERVGARIRGRETQLTASQRAAIASVPDAAIARTLGPLATAKLLGDGDPLGSEVRSFSELVVSLALDAGAADPAQVAAECGRLVRESIAERLVSEANGKTLTANLVASVL